jgi:hypothetical protein
MGKHWVVIKYVKAIDDQYGGKVGSYRIWADYDDGHIWDSPLYEVMDYFPSHKEARAAVKQMKNGTYVPVDGVA